VSTEKKIMRMTVTHGMRGHFAVLVWWNPEYGGFWEPWNSGIGSYKTADGAKREAEQWAKDEGVEFSMKLGRPKELDDGQV
jgi:hypothetical protein